MKNKNWKMVVDFMHYAGANRQKLSKEEFYKVYSLADGFGNYGENVLLIVGYDWSHVRDSSDAAINRMATALKEITKNKGL